MFLCTLVLGFCWLFKASAAELEELVVVFPAIPSSAGIEPYRQPVPRAGVEHGFHGILRSG
jgi:hypothetical protein